MTRGFKLDENLPAEASRLLANAGHSISTVLQENLGGRSDSILAEICKLEQRALITLDSDFCDIRAYPPAEYFGLIVLRLARQDKIAVLDVLRRLLAEFAREPLSGRLWIVEQHRVRIRAGAESTSKP